MRSEFTQKFPIYGNLDWLTGEELTQKSEPDAEEPSQKTVTLDSDKNPVDRWAKTFLHRVQAILEFFETTVEREFDEHVAAVKEKMWEKGNNIHGEIVNLQSLHFESVMGVALEKNNENTLKKKYLEAVAVW